MEHTTMKRSVPCAQKSLLVIAGMIIVRMEVHFAQNRCQFISIDKILPGWSTSYHIKLIDVYIVTRLLVISSFILWY